MSNRRSDDPELVETTRRNALKGHIGESLAHESARLHVSGEAQYIDDIPEPSGTVHLAPGYAEKEICGKICNLDLSLVSQAPGVICVLTADDIPGINDCSAFNNDDPVLAQTEISFHGQVLFAVVAETRDQALQAARLGQVNIEAAPAVITAEQGANLNETVAPDYSFTKGDVTAALPDADNTLEGSLRIGGQDHFYLEGQIALAVPTEGGQMKVFSSTQHPSEIQHTVAKVLDIDDAAITCECRRLGGGFGGKETQAAQWAALAALAAHKTGRPAKMRLDRDDDMRLTGKRHDSIANWTVGYTDDGMIEAVDVIFRTRCGCSLDLSTAVNDRMMLHADNSYFYPHTKIVTRRIRTNTVSNTAFRGFGGPQGLLFAERLLDQIAITTSQDPLDVRKKNLYQSGRDETPYGMIVEDNISLELLETLEATSSYRSRQADISNFNASSPFLRKGLSLTPVKFGIAFTLKKLNQAGALIHVFSDGSVQVNHGGAEMGQGLHVKIIQIVANEFGIDVGRIRITATATDKVPNASPTAASSGTDLNGMAAQTAARTIKNRMAGLAAELLQTTVEKLSFANNAVSSPTGEISFDNLATRCVDERISLSSTGFYATPKIHWDREAGKGRPFLYFAYGAACSEVTIDTLTGEFRLDRVDILHDVGRSLNPAIDIGQIEGGFVQGLGWLTSEELVFDDTGRLLTHAPSTYKIPTITDIPEDFSVELWESSGNSEDTIHRSKAVGEPPFMLAASVFSAITHAVSSLSPGRLPELNAPATPETILHAVHSMTDGGAV